MKDEILCRCDRWLPFELERPSMRCFVSAICSCPHCGVRVIVTFRASPAGFAMPPERIRFYTPGLDWWRSQLLGTLRKRAGMRDPIAYGPYEPWEPWQGPPGWPFVREGES